MVGLGGDYSVGDRHKTGGLRLPARFSRPSRCRRLRRLTSLRQDATSECTSRSLQSIATLSVPCRVEQGGGEPAPSRQVGIPGRFQIRPSFGQSVFAPPRSREQASQGRREEAAHGQCQYALLVIFSISPPFGVGLYVCMCVHMRACARARMCCVHACVPL